MKIPALPISKQPRPAQEASQPISDYRAAHPNHLRAAGGAYLVLPYGLLDTLPVNQQQQLVDILTTIHANHPAWAERTTYQVLPWRRIRVGELDDRELSWHGITSDVDPATSTLTFLLPDGQQVQADTVLGHRPAADPAPTSTGTTAGLRPPLLPAPPEAAPIDTPAGRSQTARLGRAQRLITTRSRLAQLHSQHPEITTAWADAIAATDDAWGSDETWRTLAALDEPIPTVQTADTAHATTPADPDSEPTVAPESNTADGNAADAGPSLWKPEPDDYGIGELDAELRDLVGDDIDTDIDAEEEDS